jgi:hypothetical protein
LEEIRRPSMASSTAASGQIDGRATFGWVNVARDRRRERPKHQPTPALLFRAGRLAVGLEEIRRSSMAPNMAVNGATAEPTVAMMERFEIRRTHGSTQSAGTGDASSASQMKWSEITSTDP